VQPPDHDRPHHPELRWAWFIGAYVYACGIILRELGHLWAYERCFVLFWFDGLLVLVVIVVYLIRWVLAFARLRAAGGYHAAGRGRDPCAVQGPPARPCLVVRGPLPVASMPRAPARDAWESGYLKQIYPEGVEFRSQSCNDIRIYMPALSASFALCKCTFDGR